VILGIEILKRLEAKIECMGLSPERESQAKWALGLIVPEVKKIVDEEIRAERKKHAAVDL
jgi:hypothetical protein